MVMETTYLEYINESKNAFRFYEVTVQDKQVNIRYGRINTIGTQKQLSFVSNSEAFYQANAKIDEKILKGYKIINRAKQNNLISTLLLDLKPNPEVLDNYSESLLLDFFSINFPTPKHVTITEIIRNALLYISPLWTDLSASFDSEKMIEQLFLNRDFYTEFPFAPNENIQSLTYRFRYVPPNQWLKYLSGIDIVFNTNGAISEYFGLIIDPENCLQKSLSFSSRIQKLTESPIFNITGIKNIILISVDTSSRNQDFLSWDTLTDIEKWQITKEISNAVLDFHQNSHSLVTTLHLTITG
jgi:predicted DNA-binding WGR domain protein